MSNLNIQGERLQPQLDGSAKLAAKGFGSTLEHSKSVIPAGRSLSHTGCGPPGYFYRRRPCLMKAKKRGVVLVDGTENSGEFNTLC